MKVAIELKDGRVDAINYLKGFSILTIVLMHLIQGYITGAPSIISVAASIGGTGVHVFFLCSGLGLYLSYLNSKISFFQFIKKRFWKIYTPYIIVVFVSCLLPWMYTQSDKTIALLSHVFLFKMFIPQYEESFGTQFWFISTIIQFYVAFIPLCRIKEKINNSKIFVGGALLTSIIWWTIVYLQGYSAVRVWNSFFLQYLWEFALGMCIADHLKKKGKIEFNNFMLIVLTIVGIGVQTGMKFCGLGSYNDIPALVGYSALALLIYNMPIIRKLISYIAGFSYELYLVHIFIMATVFHFANAVTLSKQLMVASVSIVLCFLVAWMYSFLISKTVKKMPNLLKGKS